MVILLLLIVAIIFNSFGQGYECDPQYTTLENLNVPEDESFTLSISGDIVYNRLEIYGTLRISGTEDIHLNYSCLIFSPNGKLIINHTNNNLIIIKQNVNSLNCKVSKLVQGQLELIQTDSFSIEHEIYETIYSGNSSIYYPQADSIFSKGQSFIIVNYDSEQIEEFEEVMILNISNDIITFNQAIKNDYYVYKNTFLPRPKLILITTNNNIIFEDICLNINSPSLSGITFLNPQYLQLNVPRISDCTFRNDQSFTYAEDVEFEIEGQIQNSLIYGFKSKRIIFTENSHTSLNQNLIMNSNIQSYYKHPTTKKIEEFKNSYFLNTQLTVHLKLEKLYTFSSNTLRNSELTLNSRHLENITLSNCTCLSSKIFIENRIYSIEINDSVIIQTHLRISQTLSLQIMRSYLFYLNASNSLSIIYLEYPPAEIFVQDTMIKGNITSLVSQIDTTTHLQEQHAIISIVNSTFLIHGNKNKYISSYFKIPQKQFIYQDTQGRVYKQYKISRNNKHVPFLEYHSILGLENDEEMSMYKPSYYSISEYIDDLNRNKIEQIIIQQNSKLNTKINGYSLNQVQIMRYDTHVLTFQDKSNLFVDVNILDLSLFNKRQPNENHQGYQYKLIIQIKVQAIQRVLLKYQQNGQRQWLELSYQEQKLAQNQDIYFKINDIMNQIEIQWNDSIGHFRGTLNFIYCPLYEYVNSQMCQKQCDGYVSGFYCDEKCKKGFYQKENSHECTQCIFGCQECSNQLSCNQCLPGYKIDNGSCVNFCSKNQYYQQNQCLNCIENCELCSDSQSSSYNIENCSQCEFIQSCQHTERQCHELCQTCSGKTQYGCLLCKEQGMIKYGVCLL